MACTFLIEKLPTVVDVQICVYVHKEEDNLIIYLYDQRLWYSCQNKIFSIRKSLVVYL